MLVYMSKDPIHRRYHHNMITFALLYAFHESFMLVLSHDEVVHGKRSLLDKMPGDMWQKFANLRTLYGFMYGHPGRKLLFMGGEFGQWIEWDFSKSLDWNLLDYDMHRQLQEYVKDLNRLYTNEPALFVNDLSYQSFEWIDFHDSDNSVVSFMRKNIGKEKDTLIFICNFTPVPRQGYRIGAPMKGFYRELINSDSLKYGGSGVGNADGLTAEELAWQGQPYSLNLMLPPLATVVFKLEKGEEQEEAKK